MIPIHPGRILKRELTARKLSAEHLSLALHAPLKTITNLLDQRASITPELALRLSHFLGTSPEFWLNLEARYGLALVERERGAVINAEVRPAEAH